MIMIVIIGFVLLFGILILMIVLSATFRKIQIRRAGKEYKGFMKEVVTPLVSSGGTSTSFIPIFFSKEEGDNEEIVRLIRYRNKIVILFWVTSIGFLAFGYFFADRPQ